MNTVQTKIGAWEPVSHRTRSGERWQLIRHNSVFFRSREVMLGKGGDARCWRSQAAAQAVADIENAAMAAAQEGGNAAKEA